jgi:hypothetical protein
MSLSLWVDAAHCEQRQAKVTDLGEEAVQHRLIDDQPGDPGLAALVASDHLGRSVKVLVEELELVGQCPIPDGRIGVEVKVRPWIDPERAARGGLDERPGGVDRGLSVLLGSAHQQGCLKSGCVQRGSVAQHLEQPSRCDLVLPQCREVAPVKVWMWRSASWVAVTASSPGLPTIGM